MLKNIIEILLYPILEVFYSFCLKKKKQRTLSALSADVQIYKELHNLCDEDYINRVIFCCLTNGGAIILPTKIKFNFIIEEVKSKSIKYNVEKYQKQIIDTALLERIINSIYSDNHVSKINIKDYPEGNIRNTFFNQEVEESLVAYIACDQQHLWYILINSKKEIDITNKLLLRLIYSATNTIANTLEKHYKLEHRI